MKDRSVKIVLGMALATLVMALVVIGIVSFGQVAVVVGSSSSKIAQKDRYTLYPNYDWEGRRAEWDSNTIEPKVRTVQHVGDLDEPWLQAECTITENDCIEKEGKCVCGYPQCLLHPEEGKGNCPIDQPGTKSCQPDECGVQWQGTVQVQYDIDGTPQTAFSYAAQTSGAVSSLETVNKFLNKYRNGTKHPCYYQKSRPYIVFLEPRFICSDKGTFDVASQTCTCDGLWEGKRCQTITPLRSGPNDDGSFTRVYYISCEEVMWDYAPEDIDYMSMLPLNQSSTPYHSPMMWVGKGPERIGRIYKKARYVRYKDSTFTSPHVEPEHMGLLGPVIRAAVGDTLKVVFRNNCPTRPFSIHPHGVFYEKDAEGSPYSETARARDNGGRVNYPEQYVYTWAVPERAGPGEQDGSSIVWLYHSHVDETEDVNSGLVGAMVITRPELSTPAAFPVDVDTELFAFFGIFDEARSWYIDGNINDTLHVNETRKKELKFDPAFRMSSEKFTLNGRLYGNIHGFNVTKGTIARWYVLSLGTADMFKTDLHGVHWHANTLLYKGQRVDTVPLMPGISLTADMTIDSTPGEWLFHCHTNHHIHAGMMGIYYVNECKEGEKCSGGKTPEEESGNAAAAIAIAAVLGCAVVAVGIASWKVFGYWQKRREGRADQSSFASRQSGELEEGDEMSLRRLDVVRLDED